MEPAIRTIVTSSAYVAIEMIHIGEPTRRVERDLIDSSGSNDRCFSIRAVSSIMRKCKWYIRQLTLSCWRTLRDL